jgi:hypothetical protein
MVLGACALRLPVTAMSLVGSSGSVAAVRLGSVTDGEAAREIQGLHQPAIRRQMVILAVIPPGTTRKTRSHQTDGTANLTCKDGTGATSWTVRNRLIWQPIMRVAVIPRQGVAVR